MQQKENQTTWAIAAAAAATALFVFIITHFFGTVFVFGMSMEPTIHAGTMAVVSWITEKDEIKRGDIVVTKIEDPETGKSVQVIKRAVGIPGDTVQVKDGGLYIDGEWKKTIEKIREPGTAREEILLGEDEYFLLGDNVNASGDSRIFGPVKRSQIEGIYKNSLF